MSEQATHIDWTTAEVADGMLKVAFSDTPPKGWPQRVQDTIGLLQRAGNDDWDAVKVSRKGLSVHGVRPGSEGDVRHFLEGAVMQANADFEDGTPDDAGDDTDRRMTETFRAFAGG